MTTIPNRYMCVDCGKPVQHSDSACVECSNLYHKTIGNACANKSMTSAKCKKCNHWFNISVEYIDAPCPKCNYLNNII